MKFHTIEIEGPYLIEPEPREDARGYFARIFCREELHGAGIDFNIAQINRSFTKSKGTLRGLHFQKEPKWEPKIVQCTKGAIYNVVADMRKDSPTFGKWFGIELSEKNKNMMYTPKGFANGFQALTDNCELLYFMGEPYSPEHAMGVRFDDPTLNIAWPIAQPFLSERDLHLPSLKDSSAFWYKG